MPTLMDMVDKFLASYISRSKAELKVDNLPKNSLFTPDSDSKEFLKFEPVITDGGQIHKLDAITCRKMALTCPLFIKGIQKKSRDTFRAGFQIVKDGKQISAKEMTWIDDFNKRNDILSKLDSTKQHVHIYGTCLWYIEFRDELLKKLENPSFNINDSVSPGIDLPFRITQLNPEQVIRWDYKNSYWKNKGIQHLVVRKESGNEYFIHPDRLVDFAEKKYLFSRFGISDVVILRHIIDAIPEVDVGTGKTLKWFSHGKMHWKKIGADEKDIKEMRNQIMQHPDVLLGDEKYTLEVFNPQAINPQPFYDWLTMCISAALVMPTHILKGIEVGRVTGAEAGYSDYHHDIADSQRLVYNPGLKRIYQMIYDYYSTETQKYVFDADIEWNPTYVSEMAEAELDMKRAESVIGLVAAGIIDIKEARDRLNQGHTKLSEKTLAELARRASLSNEEKSEENKKKEIYKAMIDKKNEIIESFKRRYENGEITSGEYETFAQELRLKDARKTN